LSYFAGEGFYGMARSSGSKKSHQSDSDYDPEDEVRDELPFLREENKCLSQLLDNHDDMLREAKKMRKELRASLEDARNCLAELETHNLDAKLDNYSLKASPVVSNDIDCCDCSMYLADLIALKDKHASTCDELDVLRVEVAELKSRPALLGACTSCPVLHGKIDEMHSYTVSLEAKLKDPIPTSCSTCEVHALENLELAHYVNSLQDENDDLRKMMGWLSGHEPQLTMMMETYKRYDGQALGSKKVGGCSGEGKKRLVISKLHKKTFHKNAYAPKPKPLRNKFDTNPDPPLFPHTTNDFQKSPSSSSNMGMCSLGKRVRSLVTRNQLRSRVERNQVSSPVPSLNLRSCGFIVTIVGKMVTRANFASRRSVSRCLGPKCEETMAKEWANKDKYNPSNGVLEPCVQMPRAKDYCEDGSGLGRAKGCRWCWWPG
jgi:hypothetical protein